ncbi:hypothetical protein CCACVL1_17778 [Corchorus capsularis]|uniref:TPM domain-containing protein n=1 Tax=Corchorus capsularis TaxID=210143 RepID=A0A1R3HQQ2_COCAP|nr:hypothetical protein CCACVL1_17778 [Corchorus capsularis]
MVRFDSNILLGEKLDWSSQSASKALYTIRYLHKSGANVILVSSWRRKKNPKLLVAEAVAGVGFAEAKVGVNKPELLPKEFTPVIDVAGFLSDGQEKRIAQEISNIEKDTGFKLRVLAQNYPDTPGLAIKDFWRVDDTTIVFVADPTFGKGFVYVIVF